MVSFKKAKTILTFYQENIFGADRKLTNCCTKHLIGKLSEMPKKWQLILEDIPSTCISKF